MFDIETLPSAWKGHRKFVEWLMHYHKPNITVELGVDYGYSLCCMAATNQGHVFGVDTFQGDPHSGPHLDAEHTLRDVIATNNYSNVILIKQTFDQTEANWSLPIDLLHIDGFHTYEAVRNDWQRWHKHVSEHGVVMFHDTESHPGVRQLFNEIDWPKINFTQSAGLGIVSRDPKIIEAIDRAFNISSPKIKVYLHAIDSTDKCRPVLDTITNAMIESQLIDVAQTQIHCNYNAANFEWLHRKLKRWDQCKLVFAMNRPEESEIPTIRTLRNEMETDPSSSHVLYLHVKGVTHQNPSVDDWLEYMLHFNVIQWKTAVGKLTEGYDTCGVNWWGHFQYPHYSGNFWWATSDYLKRLPILTNPPYVDPTKSQLGLDSGYRNDAEFWIGIAKPHAYSMHDSGIDHYWNRYPSFMYR